MNLHFGRQFPNGGKYAKVGYDHRIHAASPKELDIFPQSIVLRRMGHGINGYVNFYVSGMGIGHSLDQFLICKIIRGGSHTEMVARQIYGVGTVQDRRLHLFKIARRAKKLCHNCLLCAHNLSFYILT